MPPILRVVVAGRNALLDQRWNGANLLAPPAPLRRLAVLVDVDMATVLLLNGHQRSVTAANHVHLQSPMSFRVATSPLAFAL